MGLWLQDFQVVRQINMTTITGQELTRLQTKGSQYDNNCINVYDDKDNKYLMDVEEIMKFNTDFNGVKFNITKKRVHSYLEVCEE